MIILKLELVVTRILPLGCQAQQLTDMSLQDIKASQYYNFSFKQMLIHIFFYIHHLN